MRCSLQQFDKPALGNDGYAVRVLRPGQLRRIATFVDARDLRRREGHHLDRRIASEHDVEVVEIAAGGTHDHHSLLLHCDPPFGGSPIHSMAEAPSFRKEPRGSSPVSRILSGVAIYLRPCVTAGLVRPTRRHRASYPRAPPYSALHRVGLAWPPCHHGAGALLPHHFTVAAGQRPACCVFSVALSLGFPPLVVIQHPALWCPDFPQVRKPCSSHSRDYPGCGGSIPICRFP